MSSSLSHSAEASLSNAPGQIPVSGAWTMAWDGGSHSGVDQFSGTFSEGEHPTSGTWYTWSTVDGAPSWLSFTVTYEMMRVRPHSPATRAAAGCPAARARRASIDFPDPSGPP